MRNKAINFIRVAGEIMSGLWSVAGSVTQAFDIHFLNNKWQVAVATTVFVILAMWRMYENFLILKPKIEVRETRSIIKTVNTTNEPVYTTISTPDIVKVNDYYFGLVDFSNNPGIRSEQTTAKKVIAGLRYFDLNGNPLIGGKEIIGRWWDEPEVRFLPSSQSPSTLQEVDISPSGKKVRTLVIVMKHKEENGFFAYNMDSINYDEWRKREYWLDSGNKYICVTLAGENLNDFETWFSVAANRDRKMQLQRIEKPEFAKGQKHLKPATYRLTAVSRGEQQEGQKENQE